MLSIQENPALLAHLQGLLPSDLSEANGVSEVAAMEWSKTPQGANGDVFWGL